MPEAELHRYLAILIIGLAVVTLPLLLRVTAPYGRHQREGWGPTLPARIGWIVMESPAVLLFLAVFAMGQNAMATVPLVFLGIWQLHYLYRTFIFPFRIRTAGRRMPLVVVAMAIAFNCLNAYVNARWLSEFGSYDRSWLLQAPFITGTICFLVGWAINQHSDSVLIRLRQPGNEGYSIPRGGLYRWVSSPNYLGEILEWIGWAIATWSLAGAAFAIFTMANLLPRALANHRWYQATFATYPPRRHAVFPYLL